MKGVFGYFVLFCVCLQYKSSFQHAIPFPCELNVTEITANVPTRIYFRMFNLDNGAFINESSLAVMQHKKLHVVLISSSWSTFQYIHPDEAGNITQMSEQGSYFVDTTFPNSGSYMMNVDFAYVDFFPVEGYCEFVINVTGNIPQTPPTKVPLITSSSTIHVKGFPFQGKDKYTNVIYTDDIFSDPSYDIKINLMTTNANYIALYYCTMIEMFISQNGSPLDDMSPFLNAQVHAEFVHEGSARIWHTHAMSMNMTGMGCDVDIGWAMLNYTEKPAFGPKITANIIPELPGRWQGFLQMAHTTEMVMASFQFDVYINPPNDTTTTGMTMGTSAGTMGTSSTGTVTMGTSGEMNETLTGDASRATYSLLVLFIIVLLC